MKYASLTFDTAPSARSVDENGFLHVASSHITKATVNPYYGREIPGCERLGLDPERIYYGFRDPEELRRSLPTWEGLPLHIEHHPDSADAPEKLTRVGAVGKAVWNAPYVDAPLTVWDGEAIDAIEDGSFRELSCAYRYEPDFTPGQYEGVEYDFIMRNIRGNHVALVEEGRAGPDVVVADAALRGAQDDRWITVKPNGANNTGRPALIDENGTIKAGMGGKFNGRNIDGIPRGKNPHPVTEEKYQARQARQERKQTKSGAEEAPAPTKGNAGNFSATANAPRQASQALASKSKAELQNIAMQGITSQMSLEERTQKLRENSAQILAEYENVRNRISELSSRANDLGKAVHEAENDWTYRQQKSSPYNTTPEGRAQIEKYLAAKKEQQDFETRHKDLLETGRDIKQTLKVAGGRLEMQAQGGNSPQSPPATRSQAPGATSLNVPFSDKDRAKKAGAKWDPDAKKWYLPPGVQVPDELKKYAPGAQPSGEKSVSSQPSSASRLDAQSLQRKAQEYDRLFNEGGEGFNPYRAEAERRGIVIGRGWDATLNSVWDTDLAQDADDPHNYPEMRGQTPKMNLIKGAVMRMKNWFRGARDASPDIERQEVDLAQAIIDLHKVDPETGEIVDITEDEDKAAEIRKLIGELAGKLDPAEVKRLTDALSDLAYSKATGDADPDDRGAVMDEDVKKAMDACGLDADDEDASRAFAEGVKYGEGLMRDPAEREKLDREHESEGFRKAMGDCGLDAENPQESRAFAEGVKYGEKLERTPEERRKLDREHESAGMKKAMGKDEDKNAAIERILAAVPDLTPEQREKLRNSLADLAYSPATGDEDITAQDRALRGNGFARRTSRALMASDAALIESRAVARAQDNMRAIAAAVRDVRPLVGELDLLAFDSAANVYGYALEQCGVDARRYSREAWRGMVDMLRRQKSGAPSGRHLAQDAAPGEMKGQFAGLNNISLGD